MVLAHFQYDLHVSSVINDICQVNLMPLIVTLCQWLARWLPELYGICQSVELSFPQKLLNILSTHVPYLCKLCELLNVASGLASFFNFNPVTSFPAQQNNRTWQLFGTAMAKAQTTRPL